MPFRVSDMLLFAHYLKNDVARTISRIALNERQILPRADRNLAVDERDDDERAEESRLNMR